MSNECFESFIAAQRKPNLRRRAGITMKQLKRMPPVFRALRFHYTPKEIDAMARNDWAHIHTSIAGKIGLCEFYKRSSLILKDAGLVTLMLDIPTLQSFIIHSLPENDRKRVVFNNYVYEPTTI